MNTLINVGAAMLLFLCAFLGYREGLRLGMQTARGQTPPKLRNPVEVVREAITKPDPATTELLKGYANMMAYNGDVPKERGD